MPRLSKAEKERCHREILEMEQAKIKPYLDRIADLEKENAELKEQLRLAKEMPYSAVKEFAEEKTQDQLTKAKELLKKFIETSNPIYFEEDRQKVKAEAEQFLNSEVEK